MATMEDYKLKLKEAQQLSNSNLNKVKDIRRRVKHANAVGRDNLSDKGVDLPEDASTYGVVEKIPEVSGGGSATIDEDGIVSFGNSSIDSQGVISI